MSTTELSPGIYHIVVGPFNQFRDSLLTRHGNHEVTILPPSIVPDPNQEWEIIPDEGGNLIIQIPSKLFPTFALAYEGEPEKPKEGDKVVFRLIPPVVKWHLGIAPGFYNTIEVAGSDLGIRISPILPEPPVLDLGLENQLPWAFRRIRDE